VCAKCWPPLSTPRHALLTHGHSGTPPPPPVTRNYPPSRNRSPDGRLSRKMWPEMNKAQGLVACCFLLKKAIPTRKSQAREAASGKRG
jgi:hypothetical protein